jgi:hypothetical protein
MTPEEIFAGIDFGDERRGKRLQKFAEQKTKNAQESSITGATGGRGQAKAVYRLLGNEEFELDKIQAHVKATTISQVEGTVLLIQDTMDINYNGHKKTEGLGYSSEHVLGVKVHSCIAVSPDGQPIGLVAQSYETREEAKSSLTAKEKATRPIEEKESYRWLETLEESIRDLPEDVEPIVICDREGDIYELYAKAQELNAPFIIRVSHDRITDSDEKMLSQLRKTAADATVIVNIPRDSRANKPPRQAEMEVAGLTVTIKKPSTVVSESVPEALTINLVRITEINTTTDDKIEWILATNRTIETADDKLEVIAFYVQRWKIERFHYVLKSGCKVEEIQQRTYERMKPILLIYSVVAMYIMIITYIGRVLPDTLCNVFFDDDEWQILYTLVKNKPAPKQPYTMEEAVRYVGELGGYKRAPSDGPPGLKVMWKGLTELYKFMTRFSIVIKNSG